MNDKFAFIAAEQDYYDSQDRAGAPVAQLSLTAMCAVLVVSRSGYYDWCQHVPSARAVRRAKITVHVRAAFEAGRGTYGARRVHAILARSHDLQVAGAGLDLVRDIMRELDLVACQPRAYRNTTLRDGDESDQIQDRVGRDFTAPVPGCKLVGDITYVRTWAGWLYLATVIDCHTKGVIGWAMADHMRTDLICDAITMAATNVTFTTDAVFHSDRGSQGEIKWSSQHLERGGVACAQQSWSRRVVVGSRLRIGRSGLGCGPRAGRRRPGRSSVGSGVWLPGVSPVRSRRWPWACRPRSGRGGSGTVAACHRSVWPSPRAPVPVVARA